MQRFTRIKAWQRSQAMVLEVYRLTSRFPSAEVFGLTSQVRRAALSVPTNIAEGSKRSSSQEYARFLNYAESSLAEAESLVLLACDLDYIAKPDAEPLLSEFDQIGRMLSALRTAVRKAS